MGLMKTLSIDIEELLFNGVSEEKIAEILNISVEEVHAYIEGQDEADYDSYADNMDGDFDSAMASAGWGTDEDYGYFGEDY